MKLTLPFGDDFHAHLRQEELMETVTPLVLKGGCDRILVMPNTIPPITTCAQAAEYRQKLLKLAPEVDFLMTLYLSPEVDAEDLRRNAIDSHVIGVKSYPKGVTTNSDLGVESYERYYPLFEEMEKLGVVLHLHGEVPNKSPLTAEELFIPRAEELSRRFPKLKIVLEHVTTRAAVEFVKRFENVGATITAHHLELTSEEVLEPATASSLPDESIQVSQPHNFCKPLAKTPDDRLALRQVVSEGHSRFFLGSDSAPHKKSSKEGKIPPPAGVFTQPLLMAYVADTFYKLGCLENLEAFTTINGAKFLGIPIKERVTDPSTQARHITLTLQDNKVPHSYPIALSKGSCEAKDSIVPFRAGATILFRLESS